MLRFSGVLKNKKQEEESMIKKALFVTMAAAMLFAAAGCAKQEKAAQTSAADSAAQTSAAGETSAQAEQQAKGQYQLKIATVVSGDHSWVQMADFMAKELNTRSGGAIEVTVAPGGQLGNDETTIDDMRLGTLDIVIGGTQNAAPFVSQYQILAMPYLFENREQFESILLQDGEVFKYIQGKYDENGLGLKLLGLSNGGQRDLHTSVEVTKLADLKNMKMRVTSSATESLVWSTLGAIPTSMSFNDIYSGVQTNTVGAFECTLAAYNANALYEVAPYHVMTAHQFTPSHITCSELTWNKLPAEFQTLLFEVSKEAAELGTKIADDADDTLLGKLEKENGVKISKPDRGEFKAAVEPLYPEIAKGCKGEDLLELVQTQIKK